MEVNLHRSKLLREGKAARKLGLKNVQRLQNRVLQRRFEENARK